MGEWEDTTSLWLASSLDWTVRLNRKSYKVPRPVRICAVTPLQDFKVRLELTDNTTKEVDLDPYLHGPIFEPIRHDPSMFRAVQVEPRMGTIVWDNGADIDPDVLYKGLTPAWMEEQQTKRKRASNRSKQCAS